MEGMTGGAVNLLLVINADCIQPYMSSDVGFAARIQTLTTP